MYNNFYIYLFCQVQVRQSHQAIELLDLWKSQYKIKRKHLWGPIACQNVRSWLPYPLKMYKYFYFEITSLWCIITKLISPIINRSLVALIMGTSRVLHLSSHKILNLERKPWSRTMTCAVEVFILVLISIFF